MFRRLHAIADLVYPELRSLWAVLFTDLAESLDLPALEAALRAGSLLHVEQVLAPALARLEGEARTLLPLLLRQAVQQAQAVVLAGLARTLGVGIDAAFGVISDASVQWIAEYAGAQIVGITDTTRLAIRELVRTQFTAGTPLTEVMRQLERQVGLTPRQMQALETLRGRLTAEGRTVGQVRHQVDAAARKALALRVESIARTESLTAANAGQQLAWAAAGQQGLLDPERFRRFWIITTGDERLCPQCRPVPSLNPAGVGLYEPFQTPLGPVLSPPLHPQCRCAVSGKVLAG